MRAREGDHEVDLLAHSNQNFKIAIEIKSGEIKASDLRSLKAFIKKNAGIPAIVASLHTIKPEKTEDGIEILPWKMALERLLECI